MIQAAQYDAYYSWQKQRGQRFAFSQSGSTALRQGGDSAKAPLQAEKPPSSDTCSGCGQRINHYQLPHGYGATAPRVVFLGDMPHQRQDGSVGPLSEAEAELLERMILAMRLKVHEVYVTAAAHRPASLGHGVDSCIPHTKNFIAAIRPQLVILLGALTTASYLGAAASLHDVRGKIQPPALGSETPVLPTFHPRELLQFPAHKRLAWADLQLAMQLLGLNDTTRT